MEAVRIALLRSGWALPVMVATMAAAVGAAQALLAYRIGAEALPLTVLGAGALAFGVWRLELGMAVLILLTPFAENEPLGSFQETPIRFALVLWLLLLVAIEVARALVRREPLRAPPLGLAGLLFLAAAAIGVPISPDERGAALEFLQLCGALSVFVLIAIFIRSWRQLRWVLAALVVAGLVISLHALWQYETGNLSRIGFVSATGAVEYRVASFFPHPNHLAGFLVVMVAVGLGTVATFRSRWARGAGIALAGLAGIALLFTFSRGGLVALAAIPLLLLLRYRRAWPAVALVAVAVAMLAPGALQGRVAGIGDTSSPEIASRLDIWSSATDAFASRPLTGSGLDSFENVYLAQKRTGRTFLGGDAPLVPPENAHNLYLNTLAEQGVLGAIALVALILAIARLAVSLLRRESTRERGIGLMLAAAGLALAVHNIFDVTFTDPKTSITSWAVLGIAASAAKMPEAGS